MVPSFFTLPVLVVLFIINIVVLNLCIYVRNGGKFCKAMPFFTCGLFTIFVQLLIELNNSPVNGIILTKLQYVGFWVYFIAAPVLVSGLIGEKLKPWLFTIFFIAAVVLGFITITTNLIISSTPFLYGTLFFARVGKLYPFVCTILFIINFYYYSRLLKSVNNMKNIELKFIIPFALGLCILGGIIDYVGKLKGAPLISWLKDPFSLGMLLVGLSFGILVLFDYSKVVLEYKKSLNQLEQLLYKNYQTFNEFVQLIAKTIDAKDKYTAGHSMRVAEYAVWIAKIFNLDERQIEILKKACLLHDIGKIGIPDGVLNKTSPLTTKERAYIYKHPKLGKEILEQMSEFQEILDIIYFHHERYDGSGYPNGLKNEEIPLLVRILSVADAYDAMLSERPYRQAMTKLEAIKELLNSRGKQFDPKIVERFIDVITCDSDKLSADNLPD